MKSEILSKAVVFIVFNRPDQTQKSFQAIREHRPSRLFVIADGPRSNFPEDILKCMTVRSIVQEIDWPCQVTFDFADQNMGLEPRVISGLNKVFTEVEAAIVLEDDCVASQDFFYFANTLLEKYRDDDRVALVTGDNFQDGKKRGDASYYFSKYPHTWGWATWSRVWSRYSGEIELRGDIRDSKDWPQIMPNLKERNYWEQIFDNRTEWDYEFTSTIWKFGGLTATPNVNLVTNIGFGPDATHTFEPGTNGSNIATQQLGEITHPADVVQNQVADRYVFDEIFGGKQLRFSARLRRVPSRIQKLAHRTLKLLRINTIKK